MLPEGARFSVSASCLQQPKYERTTFMTTTTAQKDKQPLRVNPEEIENLRQLGFFERRAFKKKAQAYIKWLEGQVAEGNPTGDQKERLSALPEEETNQLETLAATKKTAAEQDKILAAQTSRLAELEKQKKYVLAGKAYLHNLRQQVRGLSVQTGETESEQEDLFLSKQLSACGPAEVPYLQQLIARLKTQRETIFKSGPVFQDESHNPEAKQRGYELGKKIGKGSTIPVH